MSLALGVVVLALVSGAGEKAADAPLASSMRLSDDRLLLCRPTVIGAPGALQPEALSEAAKSFGRLFIDYGMACEQELEAVNAARRAGVRRAIRTTAETKGGIGHYVLTLSDAASNKQMGVRELDIPSGQSAVQPLEKALSELSGGRSQGERHKHDEAAWYVSGAGAVVMAVGVGFAIAAGSAASSRDQAASASDYIQSDARWRKLKTVSGVTLGVGGAAVAAGLAWRFAF
jgi:hypothetical protein